VSAEAGVMQSIRIPTTPPFPYSARCTGLYATDGDLYNTPNVPASRSDSHSMQIGVSSSAIAINLVFPQLGQGSLTVHCGQTTYSYRQEPPALIDHRV